MTTIGFKQCLTRASSFCPSISDFASFSFGSNSTSSNTNVDNNNQLKYSFKDQSIINNNNNNSIKIKMNENNYINNNNIRLNKNMIDTFRFDNYNNYYYNNFNTEMNAINYQSPNSFMKKDLMIKMRNNSIVDYQLPSPITKSINSILNDYSGDSYDENNINDFIDDEIMFNDHYYDRNNNNNNNYKSYLNNYDHINSTIVQQQQQQLQNDNYNESTMNNNNNGNNNNHERELVGRNIDYYHVFGWNSDEEVEQLQQQQQYQPQHHQQQQNASEKCYGSNDRLLMMIDNNNNNYANINHQQQKVPQRSKQSNPNKNKRTMECSFCKNLPKERGVDYRSHWLKNNNQIIICPILRQYLCPQCNNYGHSLRYCPINKINLIKNFELTIKKYQQQQQRQQQQKYFYNQ